MATMRTTEQEFGWAYARTSLADRLAPDISRHCDPIFAGQRDAGARWDEWPLTVNFGMTFEGLQLAAKRPSIKSRKPTRSVGFLFSILILITNQAQPVSR